MQTKGQAQHYVPQFLLRKFCFKKSQIWALDKSDGRIFRTNVKNIASERRFYDLEMDGVKVALETLISKFEASLFKLINKIISEQILHVVNDDARRTISLFRALQFVRTVHWRQMWTHMDVLLRESLAKRGLDNKVVQGYEELTDEATKVQHMKSIDCADYYSGRQPLPLQDFYCQSKQLLCCAPFDGRSTPGRPVSRGVSLKASRVHHPLKSDDVGKWAGWNTG